MKQQQRCCRTCDWQHQKWTLSSCSCSVHGLREAEEPTLAARSDHRHHASVTVACSCSCICSQCWCCSVHSPCEFIQSVHIVSCACFGTLFTETWPRLQITADMFVQSKRSGCCQTLTHYSFSHLNQSLSVMTACSTHVAVVSRMATTLRTSSTAHVPPAHLQKSSAIQTHLKHALSLRAAAPVKGRSEMPLPQMTWFSQWPNEDVLPQLQAERRLCLLQQDPTAVLASSVWTLTA